MWIPWHSSSPAIRCTASALPEISALFSRIRYFRLPTHFLSPSSEAAIFTISSSATVSSIPFLRKAATFSGLWQVFRIGSPSASIPTTPMTRSTNSGITGSHSPGTLSGRRFAPSASIRRTSHSLLIFGNFSSGRQPIFPLLRFRPAATV